MQIPEEKRVRNYELTCLVSAEHTQEELDKIKEKIAGVISSGKGKIADTQDWGKKELAYTIKTAGKRHSHAQYYHFVFEAEAEHATAIKDTINITEEIIRYLLVVQE